LIASITFWLVSMGSFLWIGVLFHLAQETAAINAARLYASGMRC
jgi:hypothetical protein